MTDQPAEPAEPAEPTGEPAPDETPLPPPTMSTGKAVAIIWVFIGVGVLATLLLVVLKKGIGAGVGENHPAAGRILDRLDLQPLLRADEPITLEDAKGKFVIVNFWGTWCPPCIKEFPHLARMWERYKPRKDLLFLSVSCAPDDGEEDSNRLRADTVHFLDKAGVDMPIYVDSGSITRNSVVKLLSFDAHNQHDDDGKKPKNRNRPTMIYPTTIILDRDGRIRGLWPGYVEGYEKEMESLLKRLLGL